MEVLDDMKLGKIVKQAGFRSAVGVAQDFVTVRWHAGIGNIVRGVTKNFFAAAEFKLSMVVLQLFGIFCANFVAVLGLAFCAWMDAGAWLMVSIADCAWAFTREPRW